MTKRRNVPIGRPLGSKNKKDKITQDFQEMMKREYSTEFVEVKNEGVHDSTSSLQDSFTPPIESDTSKENENEPLTAQVDLPLSYDVKIAEDIPKTVIVPKELQELIKSRDLKIEKLETELSQLNDSIGTIVGDLNKNTTQLNDINKTQQKEIDQLREYLTNELKIVREISSHQDEEIEKVVKGIEKFSVKYREISPTVDAVYQKLQSLSSNSWTPMGVQAKIEALQMEIQRKDQQLHNLNQRFMHMEEIVLSNPKIFKTAIPKELNKLYTNCFLSSEQMCRRMMLKTQMEFGLKELHAIILGMNTNTEHRSYLIEILESSQIKKNQDVS